MTKIKKIFKYNVKFRQFLNNILETMFVYIGNTHMYLDCTDCIKITVIHLLHQAKSYDVP